jgi:hypothetical protein
MSHNHPDDITIGPDGSETASPSRIVDGDETLTTKLNGSVCVHAGRFSIAPGTTHNGSLSVREGARAEIYGTHNGSLDVHPGAVVVITGAQNGSSDVYGGGLIEVRAAGKLAGSIDLSGRILNAGARGGSVHDHGGTISDIDGGRVKRPDRIEGGIETYRW